MGFIAKSSLQMLIRTLRVIKSWLDAKLAIYDSWEAIRGGDGLMEKVENPMT